MEGFPQRALPCSTTPHTGVLRQSAQGYIADAPGGVLMIGSG